MRRLRRLFPPLVVWLLGAGLFWLVQENNQSSSAAVQRAGMQAPKVIATERTGAVFELPVASDYGAKLRMVAERPLFSETRRPPRPEPVTPPPEPTEPDVVPEQDFIEVEPAPPPAPPVFAFQGFMHSEEKIDALVSLAEHSGEIWVSVGDKIEEWTVVEISHQFIRIARDGFEHIVEINQ